MSQKTERICEKGHHYFKSSDCPTCPICEESKKSEAGIFSTLSAPARRAMENNRIYSLEELAQYSEKDILKFHGLGKASIPVIKKLLAEKGLSFKD
jgi:DNA-directed RNA polymerase alpha subunit